MLRISSAHRVGKITFFHPLHHEESHVSDALQILKVQGIRMPMTTDPHPGFRLFSQTNSSRVHSERNLQRHPTRLIQYRLGVFCQPHLGEMADTELPHYP